MNNDMLSEHKDQAVKPRKNKILKAEGINKCIACYNCMLACARNVYNDFSPAKSAIHIKTSGGYSSKFVAHICRGCENAPCAAVCPTDSLVQRDGGGVRYFPDKCIGCQACVHACSAQIITFDFQEHRPIICIQCGSCVKACPHEVLTMEVRD